MNGQAHVLLVGFGNMGQALVRGWLERGRPPASIGVVDPAPGALAAARGLGVRAAAAVAEAGRDGPTDVVVLAVKPTQLAGALADCRVLAAGAPQPVFVSIVAGKPIAALTGALGDVPAVRAMPNTPAAVGKGMTVLTANALVSAAQRAVAFELMAAVGAVEWLDDEGLMDAVTAVSGSGPAYVFLLIESLAAAGAAVGLDAALAMRLAKVTVAGAGAYAAMAAENAAELRRRVTSPGGTTEAALRVLAGEGGFPALLERAVRAAAARGRELSAE